LSGGGGFLTRNILLREREREREKERQRERGERELLSVKEIPIFWILP
jgi:hypothetical protein